MIALDIDNFRAIAQLIRKGEFRAATLQANAKRAAGALGSLAGQFDLAADGRNPQVR
jgi:hypothetical protein